MKNTARRCVPPPPANRTARSGETDDQAAAATGSGCSNAARGSSSR
jgi:hypothetical protein